MFCLNCFYHNTKVTNSRPHKKQPVIWRRRKCPECSSLFTTYERPSLAENKPIHYSDGSTDTFNIGRLIISIAKAFTHNPRDGVYSSYNLAQTIEDTLSTQYKTISVSDITSTTHQVLKRYDELAALQYAAQHRLIVSARRRGRPSTRELGQQKDELPSL